VVEALPSGVRPVILADRGFRRAGFLTWLWSTVAWSTWCA
jgi:hypothetical protein